MNTAAVTLQRASPADLPAIENLLQFYLYDCSDWYRLLFDSSGRFALADKSAYWATSGVEPFLIRVGSELAGFAVVDNEVHLPATQFNIGYFFVAKRYRGQSVGKIAAQQLLARFAGAWEVYYLPENSAAARFWPKLIQDLVGPNLQQSNEVLHGDKVCMFRFSMPAAE